MRIIHKPVIIVGDFNIPFEEFVIPGWPERLNVRMAKPDVPTTTSLSKHRVIDCVLINNSIEAMLVSVKPIHSVPWTNPTYKDGGGVMW